MPVKYRIFVNFVSGLLKRCGRKEFAEHEDSMQYRSRNLYSSGLVSHRIRYNGYSRQQYARVKQKLLTRVSSIYFSLIQKIVECIVTILASPPKQKPTVATTLWRSPMFPCYECLLVVHVFIFKLNIRYNLMNAIQTLWNRQLYKCQLQLIFEFMFIISKCTVLYS